MKSRIPFSGKGAKTQQKHGPFPPPRQKKKQKFLDLTRRGKSNDIAHRPIIQVFTVLESEFCMGGQLRIDNLLYESFIPVLSCTKE